MDSQWFLPLHPGLHLFLLLLQGRPGPFQRQDRWPLALGNIDLHRHLVGGARQSGADHERLDKVHRHRHPRIVHHLARLHPRLLLCGAEHWVGVLDRTQGHHPGHVQLTDLLRAVPDTPTGVLAPRFRLEVRETDVPTPGVPPHPRNPKVQRTGLPTAHGAVPEGRPQGPTGPTHEETERLRFFGRGRRWTTDEGPQRVRHDETEGPIR